MFRWKPPGHWLEPSRKALARSFEFLQDIANGSPQMSIEVNDQSLPRVIVQGASRRWYRINTRAYSLEEYMEVEGEYREVEEVHWNIGISAGAWKKDLVDNTDHSVSLCINPRHESRGCRLATRLLPSHWRFKTTKSQPCGFPSWLNSSSHPERRCVMSTSSVRKVW